MASKQQIVANRRNALRSTGPRTVAGKLRSRVNAMRHGLTAETVVAVFEKRADYEEFEELLINQYRPRSAVERQLVLRLSSLLWRLRRAGAIETGLFHIQAKIIKERRAWRLRDPHYLKESKLYQMLGLTPAGQVPLDASASAGTPAGQSMPLLAMKTETQTRERSTHDSLQLLAQSFMRVSRLDNQLFDRLGRYETALWRQTAQVLRILSSTR